MVLTSTYVQLHAGGTAEPVPVTADFWPMLAKRPHLHEGRMLMQFEFNGDWPTWEVHPNGDELVVLLSGEMELVLDSPGREVVWLRHPGETCLVPRGVWHTANVPAGASALFLTPGKGTENRPRRSGGRCE